MSVNPEDYNNDGELSIPANTEGSSEGSGAFDFPEGDYPVYCVDVRKEISSQNNDMLVFDFAGLQGSGLPRGTFRLYAALTPKGVWKAHEVARALGLSDAKKGEEGELRIKKSDFIGRRGIGTFKKETYNGKVRTQLKALAAHPQGPGPIETAAGLPF